MAGGIPYLHTSPVGDCKVPGHREMVSCGKVVNDTLEHMGRSHNEGGRERCGIYYCLVGSGTAGCSYSKVSCE